MSGASQPSVLRRVAREPLVGFLAAGALLFALHRPREAAAPDDGLVVVSAGRIEQMAAVFARTWMRPPTAEELQGLVREHVLEEIHVREARALGLDRDDTVIRRRLKQKLEFLSEPEIDLLQPDDEVLSSFLAAEEERFRLDPRWTFRQVLVDRDRHGDRTEVVVGELLRRLAAGELVEGDPTLLPEGLADAPTREVEARFGLELASALEALPAATWGRVDTDFGVHLVRVERRVPGRLPELAEIRSRVAQAWAEAELRARKERREAELLERFEVRVEWPEVPDPGRPSNDPTGEAEE